MLRFRSLLFALCLWPVLATAAPAHAALVEAEPASGTVLETMASMVTLEFSEPIAPMAFRLLQPDATAVEVSGTAEGPTARITLPAVEQPGTYFVEWHVVSADGHPVAGTIALALKQTSRQDAPALADPVARAGLWLATVLMFAGAFFGVGGAAFTSFLPSTQQQTGRLVLVPLLVGAVGVLVSIPLHGVETLGASAASVADPAIWRAAFATSYGAQAIGVGCAILIAALATRMQAAAGAALGVLALLVLCTALILSGHVATAEPRWLASLALVGHVAGFSFWIGALPKLFTCLGRPSDCSTVVLATFSRLIVRVIAVIIASGLVLAILQLGAAPEAWLSPYGLVLAAKLGVLVLLFAVAAWNRFVLTRPALAGEVAASRRLRALIVVEIVLVLLVLGIASIWRFTPPPRVLGAVAVAEAQAAPAVRTHLHSSGIMADFEIADLATAPKTIVTLYPETADADIRAVTIRLTPPVADAVPLALEAVRGNGDTWTATTPALADGRWTVLVEVRVGDFDLAKLKGIVRIGARDAS
jgi:copper transport protein